jgi:drug/metabolite transporter (DMT)-like permease
MQHKSLPFLQLHTAVLLFGCAGLFANFINHPALVITAGRVVFASIALFVWIRFSKASFTLPQRSSYARISISGLILALHWFSFFHSIKLTNVATGLLTYSTFPIFTALLEPIFFKEKFQIRMFFLTILTFAGIWLVLPTESPSAIAYSGVMWGVFSGFTFALLAIYNRKMVKDVNGIVIAFYQDLAAAILLLPFMFFLQPKLTGTDLLWLLCLGVVFTGLAHSLFIISLKRIRAQTAAITATLEPVYGILLAFLLFDEIPALRVLAGGMLILFSVAVTSYFQVREN